mmetsp:Transcript_51499/g.145153  ORF Transcript_51499/g.145153 Transcript_51499/m.145153 type:complete len:209 (-) Transcript_51499:1158-1784(-)
MDRIAGHWLMPCSLAARSVAVAELNQVAHPDTCGIIDDIFIVRQRATRDFAPHRRAERDTHAVGEGARAGEARRHEPTAKDRVALRGLREDPRGLRAGVRLRQLPAAPQRHLGQEHQPAVGGAVQAAPPGRAPRHVREVEPLPEVEAGVGGRGQRDPQALREDARPARERRAVPQEHAVRALGMLGVAGLLAVAVHGEHPQDPQRLGA